jgi:predicted PurR-regulated permease PerM
MAKIYYVLLCALFCASNVLAAGKATPAAIFASTLPSVVDGISSAADEGPDLDAQLKEILANMQLAATSQDSSYASMILSSIEEYVQSIDTEMAYTVATWLCVCVPLFFTIYYLANRTATEEQAAAWAENLARRQRKTTRRRNKHTGPLQIHYELKKGNKRNQYKSGTKKLGR